jgi:hypothetical protein
MQIPTLSKAQWQEDLRFFAAELASRHKNAFHRVTKEQFENAVAALDAGLPRLKEYEIVVGLQRLAAMIGDGHTFLATWDLYHFFPLDLFWFGDDLRVIRTTPDDRMALGARIVRIGQMSLRPDAWSSTCARMAEGTSIWFGSS